jgi:hypothetical protein
MAKSKTTKKYARLAIIFSVLSVLLLLGPTAFYVISGLMAAPLVIQKVALVSTVAVSLLLTMLCAINKWVFRSKIWLIVLALFFVIDNFLVMILIFGITQIADELIVSPLARFFRSKASINREIDKRLGV